MYFTADENQNGMEAFRLLCKECSSNKGTQKPVRWANVGCFSRIKHFSMLLMFIVILFTDHIIELIYEACPCPSQTEDTQFLQ